MSTQCRDRDHIGEGVVRQEEEGGDHAIPVSSEEYTKELLGESTPPQVMQTERKGFKELTT